MIKWIARAENVMRWLLLLVSFNLAAACPQWPLVIAHRGASGYLPEHSLAAYQRALEQGADIIEIDLVPTKDGVLVSRHENELSGSTDIASRAEFADRKTQKVIDGVLQEGWFSEDFTLAELRRIKLRESMPQLRPQSAAFDGQFDLVTLPEVLQLLQRHRIKSGRQVGIYIETKHPTYFANIGTRLDGTPIATDITRLLVQQLQQYQDLLPNDVYIQSFEMTNLWQLKHRLLPDSGLKVQLIQLIGDTSKTYLLPQANFSEPYDIVYWRQQPQQPASYIELNKLLPAVGQPGFHYGDLLSTQGWATMASYANGIGPWRSNLYSRIDEEKPALLGMQVQAKQVGLVIHPYTYRAETTYLTKTADGQVVSLPQELQWLFQQGIAAVFSDFPDIAVQTRTRVCSSQ
jgi:glycerophosphoryl diester phosphodiesterase